MGGIIREEIMLQGDRQLLEDGCVNRLRIQDAIAVCTLNAKLFRQPGYSLILTRKFSSDERAYMGRIRIHS